MRWSYLWIIHHLKGLTHFYTLDIQYFAIGDSFIIFGRIIIMIICIITYVSMWKFIQTKLFSLINAKSVWLIHVSVDVIAPFAQCHNVIESNITRNITTIYSLNKAFGSLVRLYMVVLFTYALLFGSAVYIACQTDWINTSCFWSIDWIRFCSLVICFYTTELCHCKVKYTYMN